MESSNMQINEMGHIKKTFKSDNGTITKEIIQNSAMHTCKLNNEIGGPEKPFTSDEPNISKDYNQVENTEEADVKESGTDKPTVSIPNKDDGDIGEKPTFKCVLKEPLITSEEETRKIKINQQKKTSHQEGKTRKKKKDTANKKKCADNDETAACPTGGQEHSACNAKRGSADVVSLDEIGIPENYTIKSSVGNMHICIQMTKKPDPDRSEHAVELVFSLQAIEETISEQSNAVIEDVTVHTASVKERVSAHATAAVDQVPFHTTVVTEYVSTQTVTSTDDVPEHTAAVRERVSAHSTAAVDQVPFHTTVVTEYVSTQTVTNTDDVPEHTAAVRERVSAHSTAAVDQVPFHTTVVTEYVSTQTVTNTDDVPEHTAVVKERVSAHYTAAVDQVPFHTTVVTEYVSTQTVTNTDDVPEHTAAVKERVSAHSTAAVDQVPFHTTVVTEYVSTQTITNTDDVPEHTAAVKERVSAHSTAAVDQVPFHTTVVTECVSTQTVTNTDDVPEHTAAVKEQVSVQTAVSVHQVSFQTVAAIEDASIQTATNRDDVSVQTATAATAYVIEQVSLEDVRLEAPVTLETFHQSELSRHREANTENVHLTQLEESYPNNNHVDLGASVIEGRVRLRHRRPRGPVVVNPTRSEQNVVYDHCVDLRASAVDLQDTRDLPEDWAADVDVRQPGLRPSVGPVVVNPTRPEQNVEYNYYVDLRASAVDLQDTRDLPEDWAADVDVHQPGLRPSVGPVVVNPTRPEQNVVYDHCVDLRASAVDLQDTRDLPEDWAADVDVRQPGQRPSGLPQAIRGASGLRIQNPDLMTSDMSADERGRLPSQLRHLLDHELMATLSQDLGSRRGPVVVTCVVCSSRPVSVLTFNCTHRVVCIVCFLQRRLRRCPLLWCQRPILFYWSSGSQ